MISQMVQIQSNFIAMNLLLFSDDGLHYFRDDHMNCIVSFLKIWKINLSQKMNWENINDVQYSGFIKVNKVF